MFSEFQDINSRCPLIRLTSTRWSILKGKKGLRCVIEFHYQTGQEITEWRIWDSHFIFSLFLSPLLLPVPFYFSTTYILSTDVSQTLDQAPGSWCALQGPVIVVPDFSSSASSPLAALCNGLAWGQMAINWTSPDLKLESGIPDSRLLSTSSMLPLFRCSALRAFCPL